MDRLLVIRFIVLLLSMASPQAIAADQQSASPETSTEAEAGSDLEFAPATSSPDQVIEIDVDGEARSVRYDLTPGDDAVVQGDIILGSGQEIEPFRESENTATLESLDLYGLFKIGTRYLWPKGILRYTFSPTFQSKDTVQLAVAHWKAKTDIDFQELSSASGNCVIFVNANECSSSVGMRGGVQRINLSPQCGFGAAVHEIGHALGLGHEQMRSDRDTHVTVRPANVEAGMMHNFDIKPFEYTDVGPYCYESIMHYRSNAFGLKQADGKRLLTIVPIQPDKQVGQRKGLADCDIETVQKKYTDEFAKR